MRIAYIANYQGHSLVSRRPCLNNFSLAARVKIQLISELLQASSHEIEILSQGALEPQLGMDRFRFRFFPAFEETERFHTRIPIFYASALSVRYLVGFWESLQMQRLLQTRHEHRRFDAAILYNLDRGQLGCARTLRALGVPLILQYEDDGFVDVFGKAPTGFLSAWRLAARKKVLDSVDAGTGVSPYLLSQMPTGIPKLLLRGVVSKEVLSCSEGAKVSKKNWVVFSGTHEGTQGIEQLVDAWKILQLPGWELHIAGHGPITPILEQKAKGNHSIVFHGLLNRAENARLLCAARVGMNAQDLTRTPGNVFAFKIVEYLAAGTHVVTTPRGNLEPDLEAGITYIPDNTASTIAACLKQLVDTHGYERTAREASVKAYGPVAVSKSLNNLLERVARSA